MYRRTYLNIPISLCIYALKNGIIGQLSLYCFLKAMSDGTIQNPSRLRLAYCKAVGCSEPTFYKRLSWLKINKWVYHTSVKKLTIISFEKLLKHKSIEVKTNRGTLMVPNDLISFTPFIYASVITYFAKKKYWLDARAGVIKRGAFRGAGVPTFSLPHQYLATCIDVPKSNAQFYSLASRKYLIVRNRFEKISSDCLQLASIRKYSQYNPQHIVVRKGQIFLQLPNVFYSTIIIKKRKFKS